MTRCFSRALRLRVVLLSLQGLTVSEISRQLVVGCTFVKKIRKLYKDTGSVDDQIANRGRRRRLSARNLLCIKYMVAQYPEMYEDEIQDWLEYTSGERIAVTQIRTCLKNMGLSRRKLSVVAKERDERRRARYRRFISQFSREQLIFIDESAKDERTFQRQYGRDLRGLGRISRKGNFTRGKRYSVLAAISVNRVEAAHTITGAFDRDQFLFAMENFILPIIGSAARREPCSVLVMDNCNIHYAQPLMEMVHNVGGICVFLPPYSPDFNPIEDAFGTAKTWLKRHPDICYQYPKRCFEIALDKITSSSCIGFFEDCHYT